MTHICVGNLTIISSDNGLSPGQRHAMNQCWNTVNCTLRNTLQLNINRNSWTFIQEKSFENICEMAELLIWGPSRIPRGPMRKYRTMIGMEDMLYNRLQYIKMPQQTADENNPIHKNQTFHRDSAARVFVLQTHANNCLWGNPMIS